MEKKGSEKRLEAQRRRTDLSQSKIIRSRSKIRSWELQWHTFRSGRKLDKLKHFPAMSEFEL